MKRLYIAASLATLLALSCAEPSKPSAVIGAPAARTQGPAPSAKPADAAAPAQRAAVEPAAPRETKPAPQPPAEVAFVPPQDYAAFLDGLLPKLTALEAGERERAQREVDRACAHAGAPDSGSRRAELCQAIVARLKPETAAAARVYLLRQLEKIGAADCVPALGGLLNDSDPQVQDAARRALQNVPGREAGAALQAALRKATEPGWRVALTNALAARREQSALPDLATYTKAEQPEVALAASAALGELGGAEELLALAGKMDEPEGVQKTAAAQALVRIGDRVAATDGRRVLPVFWKMTGDKTLPVGVRGAALRFLVKVDPTQARPHVLRALTDEGTPALQPIAARLLADIPDEDVLFRIVMNLNTMSADVQCVLLDVLSERGPKGKLAVLAALGSVEERVQVAAAKALLKLGDAGDIPALARLAGRKEGPVCDAARLTLKRLPGFNIDPELMVELDKQKDPGARAEIVRALAGRNFKLAVPRLVTAAGDSSPVVRAAVYEGLAQLAGADAAPQLIGFLIADTDEDAAKAADDAVVELVQHDEDRDRRAAPVLAALNAARGTAAARLLHVLGRLQGPAALAAIRAAVTSSDPDAADAAFRALADWPEATVLDDLLQFASSQNETRRALALRGYVRLLRLPSDRAAEQSVELLKRTLALAHNPDEQKLILAALGEVPHPTALEVIEPCLRAEGVRDEAAAAMVSAARSLMLRWPEAARAALEKVAVAGAAEATAKQAQEALKGIQDHAGTIGLWAVSGPYSIEGKDASDVFGAEFDPERSAKNVSWKPLTATRKDDPWIFDLTKIDKCSNCCLYARTAIWSNKDRPARLEIGSDDGVKVWLNGQLAHSNPATRTVTPGEDKVEIRLQRGWNPLLLKIVQSSGSWGFVCAVRDPAGQPIPELKFDADR